MNYRQAKEYIDELTVSAKIELGLDNMKNIAEETGNIQNKLKIIHIAGTNGKGSTLAFISSILIQAGYKTGMYISPTIIDYRERMQINGEYISEEDFAEIITELKGKKATAFEIETMTAFLWFYRKKCDFVVLETGLGGNLDATNIISENLCSVITPISIDHTSFLGNTLASIAEKKAGIIKKGCDCVSGLQQGEAKKVLTDTAKEKGSDIFFIDGESIKNVSFNEDSQFFDYKDYKNLEIGLMGTFQIENAVLAVECVQRLVKNGVHIPEEAVYEGLKKARWQARFETISKKPRFIIDGAHNKAGAEVLAKSIDLYFGDRKKIFIIGVMADKDYESMLKLTAHKAEKIYAVKPNNPRAMDSIKLRDIISEYNPNVSEESIKNAVKKSIAEADEDTVIFAFGSLYYLGDVKKIVSA
jgi:dihydrofolate synthase/folylpolyglutamate synthase